MRSTNGGYQAKVSAPFGLLGIRIENGTLAGIVFLPRGGRTLGPQSPLADRVCAQIEHYLADPQFSFDLPIAASGTPFQRRVWSRIARIGTGCTRSYGEIARELASSPRAVGQACGANPVPLVVPCHRVLASGGIGGFAHHRTGFHLAVKRWLLEHEQGALAR